MIKICVAVSGVLKVTLPHLKNYRGFQEGIQCGRIKLNQLPPNLTLPKGVILRIIQVRIGFLDQCHVNSILHLPSEVSVPVAMLELMQKLVIVRVG